MNSYEIVDVDDSNRNGFCSCFEDWSDEIREAGTHRLDWYNKMKDRGLGAKIVRDTDGTLCGHIQYIPAEFAPLTSGNYYFIYCIWVHGHKQGIGDRRGSGMGTALLQAAEEDIRSRGADGIAAWGVSIPVWMKASWYKKHGYKSVQKDGMRQLLWKPLKAEIEPPRWLEIKERPPSAEAEGRVIVTSLFSGICPVTNLAYERSKAVADEFGNNVSFSEVNISEPADIEKWGMSDALFVNKTQIVLGPPIAKQKIRKIISKELNKASKNIR